MLIGMLLLTFGISLSARAQESPFFTDKAGLAISGYDPVAYFTQQQAIKGSELYRVEWGGVVWQFKDEANRNAFTSDPAKFIPQYGGYCAYGVSEDHKSPTDPEAWSVVEGKLYLNYSRKVRELWRKDPEGRIRKADKNWVNLKDRE